MSIFKSGLYKWVKQVEFAKNFHVDSSNVNLYEIYFI